MNVIGIDPGKTNPGGCKLARSRGGLWTILELPRWTDDHDAIGWLDKQMIARDPELGGICVENVSGAMARKKHGYGSMDIVEIIGAARLVARHLNIPLIRVAPQTWRLRTTGSGKATKHQVQTMLKRFVSNWPEGKTNLNQSDSMAIAIAGTHRHLLRAVTR
jgi:hypothetical protein